MSGEPNILSLIIQDENTTTRMLYGLMSYKPVRETVAKFLTEGSVFAGEIDWADISTQFRTDSGIPDLVIWNQNVTMLIEIKTGLYTSLTANQPKGYLSWLAGPKPTGKRFFVMLVPSGYVHLEQVKSSITDFRASTPNSGITTALKTWDELLDTLSEEGLTEMNQYVGDFCSLLKSWYESPIIKCTAGEADAMYDRDTAKGLTKVLSLIQEVATKLERENYLVRRNLKAKWWDGDEFGVYIPLDDKTGNELWFGLWTAYWEERGVPLCFGIRQGVCDANLAARFKDLHPDYATFPPTDKTPWLMKDVDKHVLQVADPVEAILVILKEVIAKMGNSNN